MSKSLALLLLCTLSQLNSLPLKKRKENPFKAQSIVSARQNPKRNIIDNEFLIFFNEDCLDEKSFEKRDVINDFLNEYKCYKLNKKKTKKLRKIGDYWIILNLNLNCDNDNDKEIEWDDYCITQIHENEEGTNNNNICTDKSVNDNELWHLNNISPNIQNGIQYILFDSTYDPDIDIIVMDSGIDEAHDEFNGIQFLRIENADPLQTDWDNHGTHVAASIVGENYGTFHAKSSNIRLIDVKSLNKRGSITFDDALNGFDAIINHLQTNSKKGIINMSFSFGFSGDDEFDDKLKLIRNAGGIIFAAAGNDDDNTLNYSPSSSIDTITIGAHDINNNRPSWSNWGDAVDIYAPGVDIKSANMGGGTEIMSGTSMASPVIAGVAANILALHPEYTFDDIKNLLINYGINDIDDSHGNTNKPRLQLSCELYNVPTMNPTMNPTFIPTVNPISPTVYPSNTPTNNPTRGPTIRPTLNPTIIPTIHPSINPTIYVSKMSVSNTIADNILHSTNTVTTSMQTSDTELIDIINVDSDGDNVDKSNSIGTTYHITILLIAFGILGITCMCTINAFFYLFRANNKEINEIEADFENQMKNVKSTSTSPRPVYIE